MVRLYDADDLKTEGIRDQNAIDSIPDLFTRPVGTIETDARAFCRGNDIAYTPPLKPQSVVRSTLNWLISGFGLRETCAYKDMYFGYAELFFTQKTRFLHVFSMFSPKSLYIILYE
jgi:hypothetical protein